MYEDSDDEQEQVMPAHRIRYSAFTDSLQKKAIMIVDEVLNRIKLDKDASTEVKRQIETNKEINTDENGAWHVIIGKHFASSITHQIKCLLFFDLLEHNKSILIFRTQ